MTAAYRRMAAAKFALQAFDHRPARESGTQAGRLCYLGLGYVPDALGFPPFTWCVIPPAVQRQSQENRKAIMQVERLSKRCLVRYERVSALRLRESRDLTQRSTMLDGRG